MPDQQTREDRITADKARVEAEIAFAQCDDAFTTCLHQHGRMNRAGWNLLIFEATTGIYWEHGTVRHGAHLLVSGADNHGDAVSGVINTRGDFYGEPMD